MGILYSVRARTSRQLLIWGLIGAVGSFVIIAWLFAVPSKQQVDRLQQEKDYWSTVLAGPSLEMDPEIPTVEQIPYLIDSCGNFLKAEGVEVTSFNVERFAEKGTDGSPLAYALLRLHLAGSWAEIEAGLERLEASELAVTVDELRLDSAGGEALLKIYFRG